ncbi:hypothetical protein AB6813_07825 [bacterium RCC_150]
MTHQLVLRLPGRPALDSPLRVQAPAPAEGRPAAAGPIVVEMAEDGIVEITLPPGTIVRAPEANAAASMVRTLANGRKLPSLLTVTGVLSVTNDARLVYSNSATTSACALLGESPVDRVIAHYLLRAKPDSVPARFFTSGSDARDWLRSLRGES